MADDIAPRSCVSLVPTGAGATLLAVGAAAEVGEEETTPTLVSSPPAAVVGTGVSATILPIGVSCIPDQAPCPEPVDPEEEVAQAKRVDFITDNLLYRGEADPGTLDSESAWRIRRIIIGEDNDITEEWVDGSAKYSYVWNSRLTYNYL